MSEIATLEKLELFLAQVPVAKTPVAASTSATPLPANMPNGQSGGSHLEVFFSEVQYSTFVAKRPEPKTREYRPYNGTSGSLKYRMRLH